MRNRISIGVFLLFLVLLTFLPRLLSLSAHWSSDESLWMRRSRTFVSALENGQFSETLTTHHPGVTTMWLGGAAIWMSSGKHSGSEWANSIEFFSPPILRRLRLPIAYLSGVLILLAGVLLYRLLGGVFAGMSVLFLSIDPFLLAESRKVHTDVLTAEFLFLTVLLWFCYLEGGPQRRRDLVASGICFGLACLTKSHAGAFLLFLPVLLFWYVKQRHFSGKQLLISTLFFSSVTLLTVLCVWPYLWTFTFGKLLISALLFLGCGGILLWSGKKLTAPVAFRRTEILILVGGLILIAGLSCAAAVSVFERMYDALTNAHEWPKLFLGNIRYNPGHLYYPVMCFVWSAPLTLPLTFLAIYGVWRQRHQEKKAFRIAVVLLLFVLFYGIGLSFVAKKIARYLVIFLPAVSLLSATGAIYMTQYFSRKYLRFLLLLTVIVLQAVPVLKLHPYYATYHFPLLPAQWVAKNTSVGGGIGLDVAAAYLNAKPDAPDLQVRLSRFSSNLNKYFVGNTWRRRNSDTFRHNIDFDYDVEYVRGRQIQGTPVDRLPEGGNPPSVLLRRSDLHRELEHVVRLNGVDYVWIYRVRNTRADEIPAETH